MAGQRETRLGAHRRSRYHGGPPRRQSRGNPPNQSGWHSSPPGAPRAAALCLSHRSGDANPHHPGARWRRDHCSGSTDHATGPPQELGIMDFSPHVVLPLLLWGTLVGLDLVSVPQAMISRPLVAGTVAGWLAGDVQAGLRIGVLFELFALDVLPVGAVRYPDYGPATIAAVALGIGAPW